MDEEKSNRQEIKNMAKESREIKSDVGGMAGEAKQAVLENRESIRNINERTREIEQDVTESRRVMGSLVENTDRMTVININLQAKITELMMKITDLVIHVNDMVTLLKKASEVEIEEKGGIDMQPLLDELKNISAQNERMAKYMNDIGNYLKKDYDRRLIREAIGGQKYE